MPDFLTKPTLTAGAVTLRPFNAADIPRMLEILALPQVNLFTGALTHTPSATARFPANASDEKRYRAWYQTRNQQPDRLDLALHASGQLVGEVVLNEYAAAINSCNLRVLIADDATGRGTGPKR
ncbi:GNAT family N-acetyltransferase [Lacticaseibacillus jixianensis]|uniref:GNAT family N-acetyltransferase n=1 Tax=Lacticaseibacillus jixianensis TaxID=2486012 RepID=A0ABW4B4Q7_9LACO|nr:GNAT family N-acetyltransferase [Lacticaseibacillus jixianensis]